MSRRLNQKRKQHNTFDEKLYAVKQVIYGNRPRMDVAIEMQVTLATLTNWLKRYELNGSEGLKVQVNESPKENLLDEVERLRLIEKKYYEQQEDIEILKKFQASLEANESPSASKPSSNSEKSIL